MKPFVTSPSAAPQPHGQPGTEFAAPGTALQVGLVERVKNIVLSPRAEWQVIAPEATPGVQLITGYVVPLALLAVVVNFVHLSVIGISVPFAGTIRTPLLSGLAFSVLTLIAGLVGVCVVGFIINLWAPTFGGNRDSRQALKTAAYSLTPAWVSSLFLLLPAMGTLLQFIAGLYGIYVLYLGLPVLMQSRREKAGAYTVTVVLSTLVFGMLLGVVSTVLGVGRAAGLSAMSTQRDSDAATEQGAATVANVIGGALGTDEKGKAGLAAALSNLAKTGQQMEKESAAGNTSAANAGSPSTPTTQSTSASAADAPANPLAAAGGLLNALGGALGGGRHVEPVDFQTLKGLLPTSLPGLTRTNAEGSAQQAIGVKGTSATGSYRGSGDTRVEVKIADASGVAGLMDLADTLGTNETSDSDTGYEKDVVVGGRRVHEKYDRRSRHGEVTALVAKRFEVDVTGDSVDMQTLEQSLSHIDFASLEALKDSGAQAR